MKPSFDQIEDRLQAIIEGGLGAILPGGNRRRELVKQLVETMKTNLSRDIHGELIAPGLYHLHLHPSRLAYWQANPDLLSDLSRWLHNTALEAGIQSYGPPAFSLSPDSSLDKRTEFFTAAFAHEKVSDTAVMEVSEPGSARAEIPDHAFLILNGVDVYPLTVAVINIGRRADNHVVIDDPRVSRAHAQLRGIKGHYFLFDLNATGGTFVNGLRITRIGLRPGDVVSLAGYTMIYGQETPTGPTSSQPVPPKMPPGSTDPLPAKPDTGKKSQP